MSCLICLVASTDPRALQPTPGKKGGGVQAARASCCALRGAVLLLCGASTAANGSRTAARQSRESDAYRCGPTEVPVLILRRTRGTQPRGLLGAGCISMDGSSVAEVRKAWKAPDQRARGAFLVCAATSVHRARRSRTPNQPQPAYPQTALPLWHVTSVTQASNGPWSGS